MPSPIEEVIKRRVFEQWLSGEARDKIAADLQIGAGTVSGIVSDFKKNLQDSNIDSIREFAVGARKQGFTLSDLSTHIRLHNFFIKSGAAEDQIETFIAKIHSSDISPERIIALVNQLHEILKAESIPLDQVSGYIREKLEQKQKIDDDIQQADTVLQSKNVSIQAINEHIQLNEKLGEHGLSTKDIEKLLNLIENTKKYGFDSKKIVGKLRSIKRLEKKEERLRNNCEILLKQLIKYKEMIPLAELVHSMNISGRELVSFKAALNEAAETYGLTPTSAALDVINLIIDHNKKGQLKRELSELTFQKYAINEFCSRESQIMISLVRLQRYGITEDQIINVNKFLEKNGYNVDTKSTAGSFK